MSTTARFARRLPVSNPLSVNRHFVCTSCRSLSTSTARRRPDTRPFGAKGRARLRDTKLEWRPIPIGLGIAVVGALQLYRTQAREREASSGEHDDSDSSTAHTPKKRKRIKPSGPWQVQVMSTLPLKGLSRLWGVRESLFSQC